MKRKLVVYGVLLVLLAAATVFFRPMRVDGLLPDYQTNPPESITSQIFFSALSSKELEVADARYIEEIVNLLGGLKVRRLVIQPDQYTPKFKQTYDLTLHYPNNRAVAVNLLNNQLLRIDRTTYRVVDGSGISRLYDLIIKAQPEGVLNKFYYGQLCELGFEEGCQ